MGAPDRLHTSLGEAEVPDLALPDQVPDRSSHVFDRHVRVDAMLVEEIDVIRLQSLQRGVGHFANPLRVAVRALSRVALLEAELRGDHYLVAVGGERFTH